MNKRLLNHFRSPGAEYRGKPFWAWNGKLDPSELRRQIRVMHAMGLGGFFMHSRLGLDTTYLSNDWFKCVSACIDEAKQLDMEAWPYDEDRWPSGFAGGLVTKEPQYRMKELVLETRANTKGFCWAPDVVTVFTARIDGAVASHVTGISQHQRKIHLNHGESLLVFRVREQAPSDQFNGYTYLDTLNHEAVRKFMDVTYEPYRNRYKRYFGNVVPGIFTDEPYYGACLGWLGEDRPVIPWTAKLPAVFQERYGYDLIPHLPKLFFDVDGDGITPARLHFHDCITFMFVDAFARQIGEWCQDAGIELTGHVQAEETLSSQTTSVGSCMRSLEHMQAPGMDVLTEHRREYDTAKLVSSVARQFGRKWRISEMYGCTGWDFPFAGHKAVGDWQVALGINMRCTHLSFYTMAGESKRDFPASISYQSTWWPFYRKVEDYFARIHSIMARGREVRDLLVIHPVESSWMLCRIGWLGEDRTRRYNGTIKKLRDSILAANLDFDYGDEDIIARHGRVVNGKNGPRLHVNKAEYKAVIVPPLKTMRDTTLRLLRRFHAIGGKVIFAGKPCKYIDALASTKVEEFAASCIQTSARGTTLAEAVEPFGRRVSICDQTGTQIGATLHILREDTNAFYLFVCNTGHDYANDRGNWVKEMPVNERTLTFPDVRIGGFDGCKGQPIEMDPTTGAVFKANAQKKGTGWNIRTSLTRIGSRMFMIPKKSGTACPPPRRQLKVKRHSTISRKQWQISLSEPNCLVLDRPRFRIGSGRWRAEKEILRVDDDVRTALGVPARFDKMMQPWARPNVRNLKKVAIDLRYSFGVSSMPSGRVAFAIEQPARYKIAVNGNSISPDADDGWWVDRSLRTLPFDPAMLRKGKNEVTLACDYTEEHPGLEMIYLLGSFGVAVRGTDLTVGPYPDLLKIGDWTRQSLPFYSGNVTYRCSIRPTLSESERLFVEVPDYRGAAVQVCVNGKKAAIIAWEPNEVDITEHLDSGSTDLMIQVISHRRNSHGPFHLAEKKPFYIGPKMYRSKGRDWTDSYQLMPCGMMAAPRLIIKQ